MGDGQTQQRQQQAPTKARAGGGGNCGSGREGKRTEPAMSAELCHGERRRERSAAAVAALQQLVCSAVVCSYCESRLRSSTSEGAETKLLRLKKGHDQVQVARRSKWSGSCLSRRTPAASVAVHDECNTSTILLA